MSTVIKLEETLESGTPRFQNQVAWARQYLVWEGLSDATEQIKSPSLLDVLQSLAPGGFENLCKRLSREHGFENVTVTGGSLDGGIAGYGTLELNPFVSIKVLFQGAEINSTNTVRYLPYRNMF